MFAGTEDLFEATIGIFKAMFQAKGIDPSTREMIILRAAKVLNAPYEAQANVRMAKNAGLSPAEIDAAASDGPVSGINPEYVLVCKATDELSKSGTLRDETLRELLNRYGETISRKVVLMIGWFNMLSLFLNGCRVPRDHRQSRNEDLATPTNAAKMLQERDFGRGIWASETSGDRQCGG
jgi:alkylhydroperoxidase family enzyme